MRVEKTSDIRGCGYGTEAAEVGAERESADRCGYFFVSDEKTIGFGIRLYNEFSTLTAANPIIGNNTLNDVWRQVRRA